MVTHHILVTPVVPFSRAPRPEACVASCRCQVRVPTLLPHVQSPVAPNHTQIKPQISSDPQRWPRPWPLPVRAMCALCVTSSPETPFSCLVWGRSTSGSMLPGIQFHRLGGKDQSPFSTNPLHLPQDSTPASQAPQLDILPSTLQPQGFCHAVTPPRMTS